MAHVIALHGLRSQIPQRMAHTGSVPLIFIAEPDGLGADDEEMPSPLGLSKIKRQDELEADRLAVSGMSAAGYDPSALSTYVGRMQRQDDVRYAEWSPLPSRQVRLSNLHQAAQDVPILNSQPIAGDFHSIQDKVRRELADRGAIPSVHHVESLNAAAQNN